MTTVSKIFIGMDGALADFNRELKELCGLEPLSKNAEKSKDDKDKMWKDLIKHFNDKLEFIPGAKEMLETIYSIYSIYGDKCEILAGIPKPKCGIESAGDDKKVWVKRPLLENIKFNIVYREEKHKFCTGKNCILIDDSEESIKEWEAEGGTGILNINPEKTLSVLKKMAVICDDDKSTWDELYNQAYDKKIIGKYFDIKKPVYSKDRKRYVAMALNNPKVVISGETDFNFSSIVGAHKQSKYGIYKEILESINDEVAREKAIRLLEYCKQATYEFENYSLMLCNGSLQTVKGSFDMDRIDVFLLLLDNFFKEKDELILSHCSFEMQNDLRNYLKLFIDKDKKKRIYVYCNEIYHISNKKLIDDIVESGRFSIQSPDRVIEYMKLAIRFWNAKSSYYRKTGIRKNRKLKIVVDLDLQIHEPKNM